MNYRLNEIGNLKLALANLNAYFDSGVRHNDILQEVCDDLQIAYQHYVEECVEDSVEAFNEYDKCRDLDEEVELIKSMIDKNLTDIDSVL
jgi:hypothetical protein